MKVTAAPALIDALVALGKVSLPLIETVDGYEMSTSPSGAAQFLVGVSDLDSLGASSATTRQEQLGGFGADRQEFLTIPCRVTAYPTGDDLKSARDFLLTVLSDLDDALRADRTLGGVVQAAQFGPDFALYQADGPSGDRVRFDFTISADTYL